MKKERHVKIKSKSIEIQVYKRKSTGNWVDAYDCTTEYKEEELIFLD